MNQNNSPGFFRRVWLLVYPMLTYEAISTVVGLIVMIIAMGAHFTEIMATDNVQEVYSRLSEYLLKYYGEIAAVSALITIPILLVFMKGDKQREMDMGVYEKYEPVPFYLYLPALIAGAAACLIVNNLMMYSRLTELLADTYSETAAILFQGRFWIELAVLGVIVPIAEELIFRGLIFKRLRWMTGIKAAIILSAVYFGAFHGNLLQGIYAGIMGLLFAFGAERFHSVLGSIALHCGANLISVFFTEYEPAQVIYEKESLFLLVTGIAMAVFIGAFYLIMTYVYPRKLIGMNAPASAGEDSGGTDPFKEA